MMARSQCPAMLCWWATQFPCVLCALALLCNAVSVGRSFWRILVMSPARAEVTPLEKVLLIGCARLWAATAMSGTRGACVVSSDQAPRRARSMGARGSGLFNGVTQNASLLAFQRSHKRHSWHFNVTLGISSGYRDCGLPVICS